MQAIYLQQTNEASAETENNTTEELLVEKWQQPGEPPEPLRTLEDSVSGYFAYEKKATQGDDFDIGLFERPFSSENMIYRHYFLLPRFFRFIQNWFLY